MERDLEKSIKILRKGGVILYPTDTIWGLGCDATNEIAVKKVYEIKQRVEQKSLIILLENINKIHSYVEFVPDIALDIVEMATKPITIIYPEAKNLASNLIAKDNTIAIRVTKDIFCQKLIQKLKKPVVSTSANISGKTPPSNFNEISNVIKESVDYIVDYRQNEKGSSKVSSIMKIGINSEINIIRE